MAHDTIPQSPGRRRAAFEVSPLLYILIQSRKEIEKGNCALRNLDSIREGFDHAFEGHRDAVSDANLYGPNYITKFQDQNRFVELRMPDPDDEDRSKLLNWMSEHPCSSVLIFLVAHESQLASPGVFFYS